MTKHIKSRLSVNWDKAGGLLFAVSWCSCCWWMVGLAWRALL